MGMWTAIALICVAGIIAGAINDKGKKKDREEFNKELGAMSDRLESLETELRDRVATLERIVTNPKDDLKRQFRDLG